MNENALSLRPLRLLNTKGTYETWAGWSKSTLSKEKNEEEFKKAAKEEKKKDA